MTEYYNTLIEAVRAAFLLAQKDIDAMNIDAANHLMAQRRVHADGSVAWAVRFSDSFDTDGLTHMFEGLQDCSGTAEDVAAIIERHWDETWDEIRGEHGAGGDFRVSSTDYVTRSES
ncbi:hypothetical protein GWI72_10330 [Microvirga tunisiensis]|uniref:Uncharacterized protein n=2 Tax=Pannonibacter tanglangensis TaxID=2750084 RepID=A0A7X5J8M2_9HYPH|nr:MULTISPECIES: hypothetical protein [unclassified Pannonibacter]NBN63088.1 hypothetical protein [Pannonibacter sp. XCT-34]NBN78662.1 hypothetical protein [Pannonibacter sp. XCT-53]